MSATGDMQFGQGGANFLANSSAAVAQLIGTRLKLWQGEWFLDTLAGTPWLQQIIGKNTQLLYDEAIRETILLTPGVVGLVSYASSFDHALRTLTVTATVDTIYGLQVNINTPLGSTFPKFTVGSSAIGGLSPIG